MGCDSSETSIYSSHVWGLIWNQLAHGHKQQVLDEMLFAWIFFKRNEKHTYKRRAHDKMMWWF